jgi:Tfp pilus assembly protein PilF
MRSADDEPYHAPAPRPRQAAPVRQGPIDLRSVARSLLGPQDDSDAPVIEDVIARPPPDEMTRAWDSRRGSAFIWLWVSLFLLSGGIAGGYVYRAQQRAKVLAAAVARADARVLEASADGDFAARDAYAGALRAEPKERKYTAMVALAAARLAADHGEDTDAAAWAMLRRAEKEAARKPPEPDARADRELRQARGLLALARGESCPALDDKEDGDIAARCALQRGDTDGARRILAETLKSANDAQNGRALIALASLELGAGDLDAADAAYSKILTAYPGHPRAVVGKLLVAIERGELPKIADQPPGGPRLGLSTDAWFHLARGLVLMNSPVTGAANLEAANAELEMARKGITHDGRLALLYGRARLLQGKVNEAEQAMRVAERLNPNDGDVSVLDAEVALAKGYEEKVVAALTAGAQTPRKLAVLGRAQTLTGRYKEAAATLDAALAKRPGDAVSITYRAIARSHLGDAAGAQRELEKAAAHSSTAHYGLGLLAFERRDLGRARTELEKSLAGKNSEAFRARALLGRVLRELGKTDEALAELQRVAREAPALLPVHAALGRIYLDLGRDRDARTELRTVLDGGSPTPDDRLAYAEALVHLGVVDQAEKALNEATEAGVPATRVTRLRLELQSWKGPKEAALAAKAFDKERKGPAMKDTRLTLATADAYRRAGDAKRAGELYREALLGDPLHANLGIARLQNQQNDQAGAEASYRAALDAMQKGSFSLDDQTEARVGLGRALLARKASSEAQTVLEQAVEKDDGSAEAHYYLARAYQERNDLEKARAQGERAVGLDDSYADAYALVGDLNKTAAPERAKAAYKKYLTLQPDGERAKAIKKTLTTLK